MKSIQTILALFVSLVGARIAVALDAPPSDNAWDAKLFAYQRPTSLAMEIATPTAGQTALWPRPATQPADAPAPSATTDMPASETLGPVNVWHLRFTDATGQIVPALLCEPKIGKGPWPLVVAIHGLTSNKAQVCWQMAPALSAHGFAVIAFDLPCHGERAGDPFSMLDAKQMFELWRDAVVDAHQLIDYAQTRADLDTKHGVALAGYSLGSWISSLAGASDPRVKEMILMVGGAREIPPSILKIPQAAALDPRLALPHFAGRPLLLLNGKDDNIVKKEMADRLFAAAPEPKKQTWYDGGHLLPAQAYDDAARWVAELAKLDGAIGPAH